MSDMEQKLRLWDETVELVQRGYLLMVRCMNCDHKGRLRPDSLLARFGAEALADASHKSPLYGVLHCSKCQSRNVRWELASPGPPTLMSAKLAKWKFRTRCFAPLLYTKKGTRSCMRAQLLDVDTLISVFGADYPVAKLPQQMHCFVCGSKRAELSCEQA